MSGPRVRWDVFCRVVDNFGDIGVCWRLARQLAQDRERQVRLWVDDLASFARIASGLDPGLAHQTRAAVEICAWTPSSEFGECASVVIEGFGCTVPADYLALMLARPTIAWINLEYLSAERWVADFHGRGSPHPQLPLTRHFYFPGFGELTGGLMRDAGLTERREAFQADPLARSEWWQGHGLPQAQPGERRVSLFCYPDAPVASLLRQLAADRAQAFTVFVAEGVASAALTDWLGHAPGPPGTVHQREALRVVIHRFLDQDDYDHLLWACDLNFVRGEDSLVRALLAARPLVWQAYPQAQAAHVVKLKALLTGYLQYWPGAQPDWVDALWLTWNQQCASTTALQHVAAYSAPDGPAAQCARSWAKEQGQLQDLVTKLAEFADKLLK